MRNERGVTLIEMILSIILIGIIGAIAAQAFFYSTQSVLNGNLLREATQVNRIAMDRMIREIRNVRDNKCVQTATATDFKFVDGQNNTVEFSWAGAGAPLLRNTTDTLVGNVSSLTFAYYDNAGAGLAPTSPPDFCATPCAASCGQTRIWSINIDMTTQSGTETMRLRSQVHPRSF